MDKSWTDAREMKNFVYSKKNIVRRKYRTPTKIRKSDQLKKYILKQRINIKKQFIELLRSKFKTFII